MRQNGTIVISTLFAIALVMAPAWVQGQSDQQAEIARLVAQLDSPKFDARQEASDKLRKLRLRSVHSLVNLAINGSPEQMWRATSILIDIGTSGDQKSMAKIGRVLFLLANRRPELAEKAATIRHQWKLKQSLRVVEKIQRFGAVVNENRYSALNNLAQIEVDPFFRNRNSLRGENRNSTEKPKAKATSKPKKKLTKREIVQQTEKILKSTSEVDFRELRAAAKGVSLQQTASIVPSGEKSYDVIINDKWRGGESAFEAIQDLPNIYSVQISNIAVTKKMFAALDACDVKILTMAQCDLKSEHLFDYSVNNPNTYITVRGKALLGVQGNVGRFADDECVISVVVEDGPADKAGVRSGDIIVRVDKKRIYSFNDLVFYIAGKNPNDKVTVSVRRRTGEIDKLEVTLAEYDMVSPR